MLTAFAATNAATNAAGKVTGETANKLAELFELMIEKIPLWIAAFIVIIMSIIAAKIGRRIVENKMAEKGIEEEHKEIQILGGRLTYSAILMIGVTVGLKIGGIDLTAVLAAVAFGVGFALKDMIMNFLAGIMILVSRHFTIGDFINVGGTIGRVVEIQSRVTVLQAIDGTKVIVPNGQLFSKQVTSYTSNPFRRIEIETSVDYRANLKNALKVCLKVVKATKGVLAEPKPAVLVSEFGDSEIVIKVRAWVESRSGWLKIKSELLSNLKKAFEDYNIDFPYPITQLVYDKEMEHGKDILLKSAERLPGLGREPKGEQSATKAEDLAATQPGKTVTVTGTAAVMPATTMTPAVQPIPVDLDDGQQLKPLAEQQP